MRADVPASLRHLSPSRDRARRAALALLAGTIVAVGVIIAPRFDQKPALGSPTPRAASATSDAAPDSVRQALVVQLGSPRAPAPIPDTLWGRVRALYDAGPSPLWVASIDGHARADALLDAITWAPKHGLQLPPAAIATLRAAYATLGRDQGAQSSAKVDVLLTAAFILYTDCMLGPVGAPERSREPVREPPSPNRRSDRLSEAGWALRTTTEFTRARATLRAARTRTPMSSGGRGETSSPDYGDRLSTGAPTLPTLPTPPTLPAAATRRG